MFYYNNLIKYVYTFYHRESLTNSDRVSYCLKDCKLNDDFCLPDVLYAVFESDFSDKVVCPLRFPSYVMSESDSFELYGLNINNCK